MSGVYACVQVQTCAEQPVGGFVCTSEGSLARFIHISFNFVQFILNVGIEFRPLLLDRQVIAKVFLERSFTKQVEEVPIMEGTQETYFRTLTQCFCICHAFGLVEEEVILCDVISQTDVNPLCALAGRTPANACKLGDVLILLPCPKTFVGRQFVAVESGTIETGFAFVLSVEVRRAVDTLLSGYTQHGISFHKYSLLVETTSCLRVDGTNIQIVDT